MFNADFVQILSLVLVTPYVDRIFSEVRFPVSYLLIGCSILIVLAVFRIVSRQGLLKERTVD